MKQNSCIGISYCLGLLAALIIVLIIYNRFISNNEVFEPASLLDKVNNQLEVIPINKKATKVTNHFPDFQLKIGSTYDKWVDSSSKSLVESLFNGTSLPATNFPDLKYRSTPEVRNQLKTVFQETSVGFKENYKNPCWNYPLTVDRVGSPGFTEQIGSESQGLACLPYAYILGQPKCGTSDLYERLKRHPDIKMPRRKEVRWFTRGEFMTSPMGVESPSDLVGRADHRLSAYSSIYGFAKHFEPALSSISANPDRVITLDGGPHTLWWPTQSPDGSLLPEDIPPAQILRELQPNAKFIITLSDPVKRMYSDYHFLKDNLKPVRPDDPTDIKSSKEFHERSLDQVTRMNACIAAALSSTGSADKDSNATDIDRMDQSKQSKQQKSVRWFRAAQICAHDRHAFGVAGWGRITISMYVLFIEKWLEHFSPGQFLAVRLEDYEEDPQSYMETIFDFLEVQQPTDWGRILDLEHANQHRQAREPIWEETETLLRDFFKPYNELLAVLLDSPGFLWEASEGMTLRDQQLQAFEKAAQEESDSEALKKKSHSRHRRDSSIDTTDRKNQARKERSKALLDGTEKDGSTHNSHHHNNKHDKEDEDDGIPETARSLVRNNPADISAQKLANLRGMTSLSKKTSPLQLTPKAFSLDGLPPVKDEIVHWLLDNQIIAEDKVYDNEDDAGHALAASVFALDLRAIKYLLYDLGISPSLKTIRDNNRNAFIILSMVGSLAEGHPRSYIYNLLKGRPSWLTSVFVPPLPVKLNSIHSLDIVDSLSSAVMDVAAWLERAGVPVNEVDGAGNTALHYAAAGGLMELVRYLCDRGLSPNQRNFDSRTPLHLAAAMGRAEIASILLKAGGSIHLMDRYNVSAWDLIYNPGPILPREAIKYLNITQRAPRSIGRYNHPELNVTDRLGWVGGSGGWDTERLKGYEEDISCDVDQYWADEITGKEIFDKYLARNMPILVRGLIDNWPAINNYTRTRLQADHGDLNVQASDIPYSSKYGGSGSADMTLNEYIEQVMAHRVLGGVHPWYVFRGHPIPSISDGANSLVPIEIVPTPEVITDAFIALNGGTKYNRESKLTERSMFVNAQWAFGGEGTGAPVHYHNTAWNALVYGAKKWAIYSPNHQIMSNKQILDYFETDLKDFEAREIRPLSCVQLAGDVMIIPEMWGHGVLNLQESIAVATESRNAHWRIKPGVGLVKLLPDDNNNGRMRRANSASKKKE